MADQAQLAILKKGVAEWNKWRKENPQDEPHFNDADLAGMDLEEVNLDDANLVKANFKGANLFKADLNRANLGEANLSRANMGWTDLEQAKRIGANLNRTDLRYSSLNKADLSEADLRQAKLRAAFIERADLQAAQLHGASLIMANLMWADLTGADLSGANLSRSNLMSTNLKGADLRWAKLSRASLAEANLAMVRLRETDFQEAFIGLTEFADTDLREAKNLETVVHGAPSHIGIDTIYKSGGKIPKVFLRGAGVPDNFIAYIGSLVGAAFEFYSCFISYSTKDQEFAQRLYADLQANNVRCWFAPHDMAGGKKIHEQIDEAIRLHDKLMLILSPASIKSAWVETEIAKARKRETRDERRVLFPVRLVDLETLHDWECFDADTGKDSAREIREFFIPDFSDWKNHDSYQNAFQRLLKDLKAK